MTAELTLDQSVKLVGHVDSARFGVTGALRNEPRELGSTRGSLHLAIVFLVWAVKVVHGETCLYQRWTKKAIGGAAKVLRLAPH